ncbi:hypothetical protein BGZ46_002746, partial [Entomortierella lignicola]
MGGRICVTVKGLEVSSTYCTAPTGAKGYKYRLTLQNDGNLVVYRGVYDEAVFSSNTAIFPYI